MANVVHLKCGERPPEEAVYLLVTRRGRIRGEDFYVDGRGRSGRIAIPSLDSSRAYAPQTYASLASALSDAESVAASQGVETIYIQLG